MDSSSVDEWLKDFENRFDKRLRDARVGARAEPPDTLYHYTTAEGVKGIIENDQLWATNFRYVNDRMEFRYADGLLEKELQERALSDSLLVQAVFKAILKTPGHLSSVVDVFIACFCEDGDLLSQWRAYGGQGGGYAIGFGHESMKTMGPGPYYQLCRVEYSESRQRNLIKFLLDEYCVVFDKFGSEIDPSTVKPPVIHAYLPVRDRSRPSEDPKILSDLPEPLGKLCVRLASQYWELAVSFKNPYFAAEKEWRLACFAFREEVTTGVEVEFRTSGASIIPYVKLDLHTENHLRRAGSKRNFSLKRIVYGPGLPREETETALRWLIAKNKKIDGDIDIVPSKIMAKM